jgi:hypothetical protein
MFSQFQHLGGVLLRDRHHHHQHQRRFLASIESAGLAFVASGLQKVMIRSVLTKGSFDMAFS